MVSLFEKHLLICILQFQEFNFFFSYVSREVFICQNMDDNNIEHLLLQEYNRYFSIPRASMKYIFTFNILENMGSMSLKTLGLALSSKLNFREL